MPHRCTWAGTDPLYISYHDEEWGVPLHDDGKLFEFLLLEGAQAGLSWITILRKREHYRQAFDGFDPQKIARYDEEKINALLTNPGIIRNRLKINAAIKNAVAFLKVLDTFDNFDTYIWQFTEGISLDPKRRDQAEIPPTTRESTAMSKDMKQKGFSFVGPTICYAFMQAVGMVNDHVVSCFRYEEIRQSH